MTVLLEAEKLVRILPEVIPVTLVDGISMTVHEKAESIRRMMQTTTPGRCDSWSA